MTSVKQSRKDPEVEVRSAALATQELSVHEVTKSHLAHAPNHICENSGLEVQERPHPPVPPLMLTPTNQTDSHQQDYVHCVCLRTPLPNMNIELVNTQLIPICRRCLKELTISYMKQRKTFQEFDFRSMEKKTGYQ